MFEVIPQWVQNQASQREQQNPTMMPNAQGMGGGSNLASILGGPMPGGTGMMGAIVGSMMPTGQSQGMNAALGTQLQGHLGSNLSGAASGAATGAMFGPWGAAAGGALGGLAHQFSKTNNTPLQDIHQALSLGLPISDASWAQAGYGPGGTALRGVAQAGLMG